MTEYLVTFRPLSVNGRGRKAISKHGYPAFIDASCRREPDLEARFPTISSICRGATFAPRLRVGDRVAYMSVKGPWLGRPDHWRLVAWLEVREVFSSHALAAAWHANNNLPVPSNCVVPSNPPLSIDRTALWVPKSIRLLAATNPRRALRAWDAGYRARATGHPAFVVCDLLCKELDAPPEVTDADLVAAFGSVPVTRTPRGYTAGEVSRLVRRVCPTS